MQLPPTWTGRWGGKFHCVASRFALVNQGASRNLRPGIYWTVADAKINRTDITKRQLGGLLRELAGARKTQMFTTRHMLRVLLAPS
jgi:hypothetical protein